MPKRLTRHTGESDAAYKKRAEESGYQSSGYAKGQKAAPSTKYKQGKVVATNDVPTPKPKSKLAQPARPDLATAEARKGLKPGDPPKGYSPNQAQVNQEYQQYQTLMYGSGKSHDPNRYTSTPYLPQYNKQSLDSYQQPGGWGNVWDVLKTAVNPFSKEKIIASTDNSVFNTAAEYIANNPFSAAAFATGGISLAKSAIGALAKGGASSLGIGSSGFLAGTSGNVIRVAANTKTGTQSATIVAGILSTLKKPAFVLPAIGAMIGTYPWAEWALGEAKEGMIFNTQKAINTGDPEVMAEFLRTSDEIFDINIWERIARGIPLANIAFGFSQKAKALAAQKKVNDKITQDAIQQVTTGETNAETWARNKAEEKAQEMAVIDYYNQQRKEMLTWELEAQAAADQAANASFLQGVESRLALESAHAAKQRLELRRMRQEDAKFWAKEAEKQRELEAADRIAIAQFWENYRKTKLKMEQDSRPSKLNFGLI